MNRAAAIGLLAAAAWAASAGASEQGRLLEGVGAARHVEAWPEVSALARERAAQRLGDEAWALLQREVARAFAPEALQESLARAPGLDGGDAVALMQAFRQSGAVGLLGPAEGHSARALRDFPGFASQLSSGAVPATRFGLIARVDESSGYARNAWWTSATLARAFARGARLLACADRVGWDAPLSAWESGDLGERLQPFRERVHVELLFVNRERSGAELRNALQFLESETARAFHDRLGEAVRASLDAAMRGLGERLAAEAAPRCAASPAP